MSMSMDQALTLSYMPKDDELIAGLLRPMATGQPLPFDATFIHHADVYAASPEDLVAGRCAAPGTDRSGGVWYFTCTARFKSKKRACGRRQRAVSAAGAGEGTWHSEGGVKYVHGAGGHYQKFSYGAKISGVFKREGWCMTEYQLDDEDGHDEDGVDRLVLCKVYHSPRHVPRATATTAMSAKRKLPFTNSDDHPVPPEAARNVRPRFDQPQQQQQSIAMKERKKDEATMTPSLFRHELAPATMAEQDPILQDISSFLMDEQRLPTTLAEEDIDESRIEAMAAYLLSDSDECPSTSTKPHDDHELPEEDVAEFAPALAPAPVSMPAPTFAPAPTPAMSGWKRKAEDDHPEAPSWTTEEIEELMGGDMPPPLCAKTEEDHDAMDTTLSGRESLQLHEVPISEQPHLDDEEEVMIGLACPPFDPEYIDELFSSAREDGTNCAQSADLEEFLHDNHCSSATWMHKIPMFS